LLLDAALFALALGGPAALLSHPRALALLAAWYAAALTLAALRPVGTQDPVETRADQPLVMAVLFLVPLLGPPLSALGERLGLLDGPWGALPQTARLAVTWLGVLIAVAGLVVRVAAMIRLGARFSPRITIQREHALETSGLYAHVRHPGYLGALLATGGAILAFASALAWPLFAILLLAQNSRAEREETLLEQRFGDAWRDYRARTGRFIPRLGRPSVVG
jgi:protein-S-isoprenylcysteine O-methyltransferase Ste14